MGRTTAKHSVMNRLHAMRTHRTLDDIPPQSSDAELLAWSHDLLAPTPIRARRREPLRAVRIAPAPARDLGSISTEELFAEIKERATNASRV
jgi:hypothetical protein